MRSAWLQCWWEPSHRLPLSPFCAPDTTNCMEVMTGRLSKCGKNPSAPAGPGPPSPPAACSQLGAALPPLGLSWGLCVAWGPDTHAGPSTGPRTPSHRPGPRIRAGREGPQCSERAPRPVRVACAGSDLGQGALWSGSRPASGPLSPGVLLAAPAEAREAPLPAAPGRERSGPTRLSLGRAQV